jgi:hypothetical protein
MQHQLQSWVCKAADGHRSLQPVLLMVTALRDRCRLRRTSCLSDRGAKGVKGGQILTNV